MKSIHYRGHKFKKKLTKEELKDLASDNFQQVGLDKHVQSCILCELCNRVESSKNPKFFSLLSTPKNRNSNSWIRAYSLVLKFLEEFKMSSTITTINTELKGLKISYDFSFLESNSPSQFLNKSIRNQRRNRRKFSIRVSAFKMPPPLIVDENIDDFLSISIQKKKSPAKKNKDTNIKNNKDFENEDASYISGDDNSHFNVSSIDALADDSFVNNN